MISGFDDSQIPSVEEVFGLDKPPVAERRPELPPEDRLTEAGAAERFARRHADHVRFDHRRGRWLMWAGHRWTPDTDGAITRLGLEFTRTWQREAVEIPDLQTREAVLKAAIRLERKDALVNVLALARDLKPLSDAGEHWDQQPYLLGVPNGVIDLHTGTLRAGRREDRITMQASVPYDPDAPCPRFQRFVLEVSNGSDELATYHQRHTGYSLTASVSEQSVILWNGTGSNGKSTFGKALLYTFGDYGDIAAFTTFERASNRGAIPNDLAALAGKRLIIASETREGARLDEGRLKSISGGDRLRARFLNQEWFSFDPSFKLILCINHRPVISDDSFGFWRRVRLVPFTATFTPDSTLEDTLRTEAPGILAWAVRGCVEWQRDGIQQPAAVETATEDYRVESDRLADFLEEACERSEHSVVRASELFDHYKQWAERRGLGDRERLSATMFGIKMAERFERTKTKHGASYEGLARRPFIDEVTG